MERFVISVLLLITLAGCDFQMPGVEETFAKQNLISAVSLIEVHKLRNSEYPNSLKELEFLGDWDEIWLSSVRYEKNGDGYNLFLEQGFSAKPELEMPVKFKQGLGIKESNVKWLAETEN